MPTAHTICRSAAAVSSSTRTALPTQWWAGWTSEPIVTMQTGEPVQLTGENNTFNDYGDSGVTLNNVTASQLQHAVGVHRVPGQTFADLIDPKYLSTTTGGGANTAYIAPNTTPGTIGQVLYLHGPHQFYQDVSLTKSVPIHDALLLPPAGLCSSTPGTIPSSATTTATALSMAVCRTTASASVASPMSRRARLHTSAESSNSAPTSTSNCATRLPGARSSRARLFFFWSARCLMLRCIQ